MDAKSVEAKKGTSAWSGLLAKSARWGLLAAGLFLFTSASSAPPRARPSLVVGVAEWRNGGGDFQDIQAKSIERLEEELQVRGLDRVLVVPLSVTLANAREVDAVTDRFGVDVLVWGWYDEIAVRGYVDLADATTEDGMANSLGAFLERGGSPDVIQVLDALKGFDYVQDCVSFCVPRWTP